MSTKLNMKSILKAAGDANCYDGPTVVKAFNLAAEKGYTSGVISSSWMERVQGWASFNEKAMHTLIDEKSPNYAGNYVDVPDDILSVFGKSSVKARKTRKTKSSIIKEVVTDAAATATTKNKAMNLRTLLANCHTYHIDNATDALDILQKMKDSGYEVDAKDIDFAQGWRKFNDNAFKKMAENTYNGTNGFAKRELFDCPDFSKFVPLDKLNGSGKALNARTVLEQAYKKHCTDAIKILATLQDLQLAGYSGVEEYNIPGLVNKTTEEVEALLDEAHSGKGDWKKQKLIADCPELF